MTVEIFCCYARKDQSLLIELKNHLIPLQRQGLINLWHDTNISPGSNWQEEIDKHLDSAQIILLLISPNFMASDYCYSVEMKRALERQEQGGVRVIPILLRPTLWKDAPFGKLQVLPINARPVTSWRNREEAYFNIAMGIKTVLEEPSVELLHVNHLISEYHLLLASKEPDQYRFRTLVTRMITEFTKIPSSPLMSLLEDQPIKNFYGKQNLRLGELYRSINDLQNALEAYQYAFKYALDNETVEDLRNAFEEEKRLYQEALKKKDLSISREIPLILQSGMPLVCLLAYLERTQEAITVFKTIIDKIIEVVPDNSSIDITPFMTYILNIAFFEDIGMVNPLVLVFNQDHYRFNRRIQQAVEILHLALKEMMGEDFDEEHFAFGYAELLFNEGVLLPALKYYQQAEYLGNTEVATKIETVQTSLETADWMVKSFIGISVPLPKKGLIINSPRYYSDTYSSR